MGFGRTRGGDGDGWDVDGDVHKIVFYLGALGRGTPFLLRR